MSLRHIALIPSHSQLPHLQSGFPTHLEEKEAPEVWGWERRYRVSY